MLDPAERFTVAERAMLELREQLAQRRWLHAIDTARFLRGVVRQFEAACEDAQERQQRHDRGVR